MKLTKIYADDCDVCQAIGDRAEPLATGFGFEYEEVELMALAAEPGAFRDYIVNYHVDSKTGMIDLPIYVITTDKGDIQASGRVTNLEEVSNLIYSWQKWESSQKQSSAD